MNVFKNRVQAGKLLANKLLQYKAQRDIIVLGLPRGGIPVAFEVAKALDAPLEVFLVRKLGVPGQEELAMGAIASGEVTVFNNDIISSAYISQETIETVKAKELSILKKREQLYRGDRPILSLKDKIVILIDDGIATGATMRVAVKALKKSKCKKIIVATPVAPPDTCALLQREVDEVVSLATPYPFFAIGGWYENFTQTSDEEVCDLLKQAENFGEKER